MKEIDEKLFEELSKDDLDEEINESSKDEKKELRYLHNKEKVCPLDKEERYKLQSLIQKHGKPEDSLEEERLEEGTSNFPTRSSFPLYVFYTIDEFYDMMHYAPDYPQEEQFEHQRENGDFYIDWDAFEDAKDEFEQKYWDENDICVLDEDSIERLEDKLYDFNKETENIANNIYDNEIDDYDNDDYYALKDIELKIESGYYEAAYIDVDGEEQFGYMSEKLANEQRARFNNFLKELSKEFGLTKLGVAWGPASNGETGFKILRDEDESLKEEDKPICHNCGAELGMEKYTNPKTGEVLCADCYARLDDEEEVDESLQEELTYEEAKKLKEGTPIWVINPYTDEDEIQAFERQCAKPRGYIYSLDIHPYDIIDYDEIRVATAQDVKNEIDEIKRKIADIKSNLKDDEDDDYGSYRDLSDLKFDLGQLKDCLAFFNGNATESLSENIYVNDDPVRYEGEYDSKGKNLRIYLDFTGSSKNQALELLEYLNSKNAHSINNGIKLYDDYYRKKIEKVLNKSESEFNRFAISFVFDNDYVSKSKGYMLMFVSYNYATENRPVRFECWCNYEELIQTIERICGSVADESVEKIYNNFFKKKDKNKKSLGEEEKLVEKPIGLDSGEFVPEDEIGIIKQKDSGEFTGVRRAPGKPVEYVAGVKDVDKDSKAIGALSKLSPEQRKKAWNKLMKQESLKEGVEFIDSIELGTRTIGDGPYHDGDGVIYLLKDGDKYYAEYAVEDENGPIEDPEYLEEVGEHDSIEELKASLKEHNWIEEELQEKKKKKKEPFVKVGTGFDIAKDTQMTNHMLGSDCCEDLDSLASILDELKDAIVSKDSKKEKQLRSALRRLGMDDMTQNILLSEDFDEFDTDSYYKKDDICIYQFPASFNEVDFKKAKEFGLELLGRVNELGFGTGDPLIKGKYKDLKRFCSEYLDYVMHPYYLYKEGDIDLEDILEPADESWKRAEALGEEKLEEKKFDGKCPYCGSENIDFVDSDEDSEKHVCHDCGQDFLVHDDDEVTTRNNRPIESLEESNKKFALVVNGEWFNTFDTYEEAQKAQERFLDAINNEEDAQKEYGASANVEIKEIDEELKESMKSEVTNWWKDVEDANREMKWEINIDNGDYDDVEAMHAAMFDMLDELDNRGASELFKRGKKIYNKYAKYSKYNEELEEDLEVARTEYCVMDNLNNNIECFDNTDDAIAFAKDNEGVRVLEVKYGPKNDKGDEPELSAEEVWSIRENLEESKKEVYIVRGENADSSEIVFEGTREECEQYVERAEAEDAENYGADNPDTFEYSIELKEELTEDNTTSEVVNEEKIDEEKVEESYADARYKIEYWADEEARDHGLGDYALERFDDLEDAKEYADKLFGDVASVEVLDTQDDDNVVYGRYPEDESCNEGGPGSGDHRTAAQRYNDKLNATFRRFDEMNNKMAQFLLDHDVSPEEVEELKKNTGLHGNALHQKLIELGLDDEFFERKRECKESINAWSIKPNETNEEIEILVKKNDTWESIASVENCPTKDMLKEDIVKEYSKVAKQVIKESGYRLVESNDDVYSLHVKVIDANTGKVNKVERLMSGSKKECDARKKQLEETSPEDSYHNKNVYKVSKVK